MRLWEQLRKGSSLRVDCTYGVIGSREQSFILRIWQQFVGRTRESLREIDRATVRTSEEPILSPGNIVWRSTTDDHSAIWSPDGIGNVSDGYSGRGAAVFGRYHPCTGIGKIAAGKQRIKNRKPRTLHGPPGNPTDIAHAAPGSIPPNRRAHPESGTANARARPARRYPLRGQ